MLARIAAAVVALDHLLRDDFEILRVVIDRAAERGFLRLRAGGVALFDGGFDAEIGGVHLKTGRQTGARRIARPARARKSDKRGVCLDFNFARRHEALLSTMSSSPQPSFVQTISVIMPVWRESDEAGQLAERITALPEVREVIVVAADASGGAAGSERNARIRRLQAAAPSRGAQMNLGAREAGGEWLLFQHADTELTAEHVRALAALTPREEIVGGAFYRRFDERHPRLRGLEKWERLHNRSFGALYGDQSIFARREVFTAHERFRRNPAARRRRILAPPAPCRSACAARPADPHLAAQAPRARPMAHHRA